jgi:hypothetical protein
MDCQERKFEKFRVVLLYLLDKLKDEPHVAETVIYKHLYFIDFDYYEKYEKQLIGATYIKNKYGPTPNEFYDWANIMIMKGEIKRESKIYYGHRQIKYFPLKKPNLRDLESKEIEIIDNVIKKLSNKNGKQISKYSHKDIPYLAAEDNRIIEYESVFYRIAPYSVRECDE